MSTSFVIIRDDPESPTMVYRCCKCKHEFGELRSVQKLTCKACKAVGFQRSSYSMLPGPGRLSHPPRSALARIIVEALRKAQTTEDLYAIARRRQVSSAYCEKLYFKYVLPERYEAHRA